MFLVLRKRLTLRGFIVWDFAARQADFLRDMGEWVGGGRVKYHEDVVEGLENRLPRSLAFSRARTSASCW